MIQKAPITDDEKARQWAVIEDARASQGVKKSHLSKILGDRHDSYYYQAQKGQWDIPLDVLGVWSDALGIPPSELFMAPDDPRGRIITLLSEADENQLPQVLRVLEALLLSK